MRNLPRNTAGQLAALMKQSRKQKNSAIEITVPRNDGDILLRETLVPEELDQVFNLVYRVYVEEMGLVNASALPSNQAESKQKFDDFDFAPSTRHLVALCQNRVVGCMRLVDEVEGTVPMERNGFSLEGERRLGHRILEVGKLIIEPSYRGTAVCMEFLRLIFSIARLEDDIHVAYLSCEPRLERLYARVNAVRIGRFENGEFHGRLYSVMRAYITGPLESEAVKKKEKAWSNRLKTKQAEFAEVTVQ